MKISANLETMHKVMIKAISRNESFYWIVHNANECTKIIIKQRTVNYFIDRMRIFDNISNRLTFCI